MKKLLLISGLVLAAVGAAALLPRHPAVVQPPRRSLPPVDPARLPALPGVVAEALARETPLLCWSFQAAAKLEPCGCVAGMHGGLARRAALLTRVPPERRLTLEGGGWSGGGADYQLVRTQHYLQGLKAIGCDALGLGGAELRLGAPGLARLLAEPDAPPAVSANLRRSDGVPLAQPFVRVERGGLVWAVTAVAPAGAGPGLVADDPAESLVRLLPQIPAGARLLVLADLPQDQLVPLARAVPGLAALLGGDTHAPSLQPVAAGATRVAWVGNEGKTVAWWPWGGADCAFELISDGQPDHPELRRLIHAYQERLGAMDLAVDDRLGGMTEIGAARSARYLGDAACTPCHSEAARVHEASAHARALASLETRGYQGDPDCLRCHVVALGQSDGWRRRAPRKDLGRVGCESCHGPGSQHVSDYSSTAGTPIAGSLQVVTPATCTQCHDRENSPAFDYATYWPRILHQ